MTRSRNAWIRAAWLSVCGANASTRNDCPAWRTAHDRVAPGLFPPELVVQIKAIACELPAAHQQPLARWSVAELAQHARTSGLVASLSESTVWRWLHQDAIRPWQHRCWIFPRDPDFARKAARLLDLYARIWEGQPLGADEFVLSADEKTSVQARARIHATVPGAAHRPTRVEHEYERRGAWAYLAAWDVHRAKVFGRCEAQSGIAPFDRLVHQVMTQPPYQHARRVFWIVDNGSSHRGARSVQRLQNAYPNLVLVHGPVHASWLNQIEIYFSIVQRKALTPNDFPDLDALADRLARFERHFESTAEPFEGKFTRADLHRLLAKLNRPAAHAA
jgi:hypothetical protein